MVDYAPFGVLPAAPSQDAAPAQSRFPPEVMAMLLERAKSMIQPSPTPQMSDADQAAMSPETYANPMAKQMIGSLATLPKRAIDAAGQDVQHLGDHSYEPQLTGPALEAALLPMGAGLSGVARNTGETVLGAGMIPKGTTRAEWSALRQQQVEGRDALKKIHDAMNGPIPEHVDPFSGMNDAETAAAFEKILRAVSEPSPSLQQRISDAVRTSGGTGVRISDVAAKIPDVPLKDIHAEMLNMQRSDKAVLSNWDDPRSTTSAMKAAAINIGGDPRHAISLLGPDKI